MRELGRALGVELSFGKLLWEGAEGADQQNAELLSSFERLETINL